MFGICVFLIFFCLMAYFFVKLFAGIRQVAADAGAAVERQEIRSADAAARRDRLSTEAATVSKVPSAQKSAPKDNSAMVRDCDPWE